jgi:hypothetical protein
MEDYESIEHGRHVTIDPEDALTELRAGGIEVVDTKEELIEIARANSTTPRAVAEIIMKAAMPAAWESAAVPAKATLGRYPLTYSGLGRMTTREYAEKYSLDLDGILSTLSNFGTKIDPDQRLRDEGNRLGIEPEGLISLLNSRAPESAK